MKSRIKLRLANIMEYATLMYVNPLPEKKKETRKEGENRALELCHSVPFCWSQVDANMSRPSVRQATVK